MSKPLLSYLQEALDGHARELRQIADELDFESGGMLVLDAAGWKCQAYKPWIDNRDRNGRLQEACRSCPGVEKCTWSKGVEVEAQIPNLVLMEA